RPGTCIGIPRQTSQCKGCQKRKVPEEVQRNFRQIESHMLQMWKERSLCEGMPKPRTSWQGETKGIRQKDNSPEEFSGGTHRRLRLGFRSIDVQDTSTSRIPEIVCRKLTSVGIDKTISASGIDIPARINGHLLIVEIDSGCDITGINPYLVYKLELETKKIDSIKITNADRSKNASNITDKEAEFILELLY